ncbi:MAG: hypothetical protein KF773_01470 [Deltaproteobacteria bacterium]|nr:hypothetical protein [Deltaproteobacteria bacterium]
MKRSSLLAASCLLFAACAVDPATGDADDDGDDPAAGVVPTATNGGTDGVAPPPVHLSVRNARVTCGLDFDGNEHLTAEVESDLHVRFAFASFHRGADSDATELDRHLPAILRIHGATIFSQTALVHMGRFQLDERSPITCANLGEFAIKAVVAFENGSVGCALGGNATEMAKLRCED